MATVVVDSVLDVVDDADGKTSLREAIATANATPGLDEIVFDFGHDGAATIELQHGELELQDALTIRGTGSELLTIDAHHASRIFNITAATGDYTFSDLHLTRGRVVAGEDTNDFTYDGGAIRSLTDGIVFVANSGITECELTGLGGGGRGGAVFTTGDLIIQSSEISSIEGDGGAIHVQGGAFVFGSTIRDNNTTGLHAEGSLTVRESTVSGNARNGLFGRGKITVNNSNVADNQGGIRGQEDVVVTGSTISGNSHSNGGGIYASGNVAVTGSTISGNSGGTGKYSGVHGGGIHANGDVVIDSSVVSSNIATSGGGIYANGDIKVVSSLLTSNSSSQGGAIYGGAVEVVNSTISGNDAAVGGGIYVRGDVIISSSTFAGNTANRGGGVYHRGGNQVIEVRNSIVAENVGHETYADIYAGESRLLIHYSLLGDADGLLLSGTEFLVNVDPQLGPLRDNGGLTPTHALLPGSPAIDRGSPSTPAHDSDQLIQDQRGAPYTRVRGDRTDMGAHEYQGTNVEFVPVASPVIAPVEAVTIQFSAPVVGFDLSDLALTLNGGPNRLDGSQMLTIHDSKTFVLSNLASVTSSPGYYTLTLRDNDAELRDAFGAPLDSGEQMSWAMGPSANRIVVNSLDDETDFSIDDGDVSLRDAIAAAMPGGAIVFDPSLSGGTIATELGEFQLQRPVTIDGTSLERSVTIRGGRDTEAYVGRIFNVDDGDPWRDSPVELRGLTLAGGRARGDGGAVRSRESLSIVASTIHDNVAAFRGGGVSAWTSLEVFNSTISGNSISSYRADGSGIFVAGMGRFTGVTLVDNVNRPTRLPAGALFAAHSAQIRIANSILAGNSQQLRSFSNDVEIQYSLLSDNDGSGLAEAPVGNPDEHGNIVGGPTHGVVEAQLGPLADNGGRSLTHSLLPGSPAIDAGDPLSTVDPTRFSEFDQRGGPHVRVADGDGVGHARIDMGAFEAAAAFVVDTLDDEQDEDYSEGDLSLREAINLANGAIGRNRILFDAGLFLAPQTIALQLGELEITDELELYGPGAELLSIDAQQQSRVFNITTENGNYRVVDMTLQNGLTQGDNAVEGGDRDNNQYSGGAIRSVSDGRLTLVRSRVIGSGTRGLAAHGGGIFAAGNVTLESSEVAESSTRGSSSGGGGLFAIGDVDVTADSIVRDSYTAPVDFFSGPGGGGIRSIGNVFISNSRISGNASTAAGAGVHAEGNVDIANSKIIGNTGWSKYTTGGVEAGGDVTVSRSTLANNVGGHGGAISSEGDVFVASSTISGTQSSSSTGTIKGNKVSVENSTISGNKGVGVHAQDSATLSFSTITNNHGAGLLTGRSFSDTTVVVEMSNSILAGNGLDTNAEDWRHRGDGEIAATVRYSLIGNSNDAPLAEAPPGAPDDNGNLIGGDLHGIIDAMLGPLSDNGGPTLTHALLPGSPALDAGDPDLLAEESARYDQRGSNHYRRRDGNGDGESRFDMGAYEAQRPPLADFDENGFIDGSDFLAWQRGFGMTTAIPADGDSDDDQDVDASDLAAWDVSFDQTLSSAAPANATLFSEPAFVEAPARRQAFEAPARAELKDLAHEEFARGVERLDPMRRPSPEADAFVGFEAKEFEQEATTSDLSLDLAVLRNEIANELP